MPTVNLAPLFNDAQFDNNGNVLSGGKVYWYLAGTSTPHNTYTDNTGTVAQANPVILNARGEPASPIWLEAGTAYKAILKDALDNTIRTIDGISGVNDVLSSSLAGHGQCRLTLGGANNLQLIQHNGSGLWINGAIRSIPQNGVQLISTVSGSSIQFVYAVYDLVTQTMSMELSGTTPGKMANGVYTKFGDTTKTLVGMVNVVSGFIELNATSISLLSWFNRVPKKAVTSISSQATSSGTFIELDGTARLPFISWPFELFQYSVTGTASINAVNGVSTLGIGNGNTTPLDSTSAQSSTSSAICNVSFSGFDSTSIYAANSARLLGAASGSNIATFSAKQTIVVMG